MSSSCYLVGSLLPDKWVNHVSSGICFSAIPAVTF